MSFYPTEEAAVLNVDRYCSKIQILLTSRTVLGIHYRQQGEPVNHLRSISLPVEPAGRHRTPVSQLGR